MPPLASPGSCGSLWITVSSPRPPSPLFVQTSWRFWLNSGDDLFQVTQVTLNVFVTHAASQSVANHIILWGTLSCGAGALTLFPTPEPAFTAALLEPGPTASAISRDVPTSNSNLSSLAQISLGQDSRDPGNRPLTSSPLAYAGHLCLTRPGVMMPPLALTRVVRLQPNRALVRLLTPLL